MLIRNRRSGAFFRQGTWVDDVHQAQELASVSQACDLRRDYRLKDAELYFLFGDEPSLQLDVVVELGEVLHPREGEFWRQVHFVKMLLRDRESGAFFRQGSWVSDAREAQEIGSVSHACDLRRHYQLQNAELYFLFGEEPSPKDVVVELGHFGSAEAAAEAA